MTGNFRIGRGVLGKFTRLGVIGILAAHAYLWSQQYVISTIAGGGVPTTPVAARDFALDGPATLTLDAAGNLYFGTFSSVWKMDAKGLLTRLAGTPVAGYSGDGGPATSAQLYEPRGIAVDASGSVYVADNRTNRVRKISPAGIIITVAGTGTAGYSGDGGPAVAAQLSSPKGLALDPAGNLYIADFGRIRKLTRNGIITTIAGNGVPAYSGDGGPAANAQLEPYGIALDAAGNLYVADQSNNRIRKIASNQIISTVAGNGLPGFCCDGGPAISAAIFAPGGVAVDAAGDLYFADRGNNRARRVSLGGIITTVAGSGDSTSPLEDGLATKVQINPSDVAVDGSGNFYIPDHNCIRKVATDGMLVTIAGNGAIRFSGDGRSATNAQIGIPTDVAVDVSGNAYIADINNARLRRIAPSGIITTVAGNGSRAYSGDGGPAENAGLVPSNMTVDALGNVYLSDYDNSRIRKITPGGIIGTIAGNGMVGFSGDGGAATGAQFWRAQGLALDAAGNLYVADTGNNRVRKVSPDGMITTFAGNGAFGFSGDGGPATDAPLSSPAAVAADSIGNVYIADTTNNRIRKVAGNGVITTIAGGSSAGFSGDGGPATGAQLRSPQGVAVDRLGNVYIADSGNNRIRKIGGDGVINTIAGNGTAGYSGDGGSASNAQLSKPVAIAVDAAGNVYVADSQNYAIRLLEPESPAPTVTAVVNAASNLPGPLAPGEIVVVYHTGIGPAQITHFSLNPAGLIGSQLDRTMVSFNGTPAPLIYTWTNQLGAIVPYSVAGANVQVQISYRGQTSAPFSVPVAATSPGIFTADSSGQGQAAALNQDTSYNNSARPAKLGDIVVLYATGEGQTSPPGIDGKPATLPLPFPLIRPTVMIGGQSAEVLYAGGAYGLVGGLIQVNARIPVNILPGKAVPVLLQCGNAASQPGATIAVAGN